MSDESIDDVRVAVKRLARSRIKKFYHSASNTHIVWQPDVGAMGIRGTGGFPDIAYQNFLTELDSWLAVAPMSDLQSCRSSMQDTARSAVSVKEVQVRVPERIKEVFQELASKENIPLGQFVLSLIREQLGKVNSGQLAEEILHERSKKVISEYREQKSYSRAISLRFDPSQIPHLETFADEVDLKESQLIKSLMLSAYSEQRAA